VRGADRLRRPVETGEMAEGHADPDEDEERRSLDPRPPTERTQRIRIVQWNIIAHVGRNTMSTSPATNGKVQRTMLRVETGLRRLRTSQKFE